MKNKLRYLFIQSFDFLWEDYKFAIISDKIEKWGYILEAKNTVTGIKFIYEYKEAFVNVIIYRLVDGELIENTTHAIINDEKINGFSLNRIISVINPSDLQKVYHPKKKEVDENNDLEIYLEQIAVQIRKYLPEILKGNFNLFCKLDKIVKEEYKSYYKN